MIGGCLLMPARKLGRKTHYLGSVPAESSSDSQVKMPYHFMSHLFRSSMKAQVYSLFFALLVCCGVASAQTGAAYPGDAKSRQLSASTLSGGINLRSVEGAPFSADVVSEFVEVMPDGAAGRHETHGKMFRDSAGRTRSETELQSPVSGAESRRFVTIVDPVQQLSIVLDRAAQTAGVSHLPPAGNVKLAAVQAARPSGAGRTATAGTEDLGGMMMEGFSVTGTRRTRPAEAGAAPDKTAVTESWFSPELKVELLAMTRVSRSTTRTTRLTNIVPGEPDPSLFQIPAGYAVRHNLQQK
jgi:hypothetical protein